MNKSAITTTIAKIPLYEINSLLTCFLCKGYFREAHTIPSCLHTFCKSCIIEHFRDYGGKSLCCPRCETSIGSCLNMETLMTKIIYDGNLQGVVDKLFPEFSQPEVHKKRTFTTYKATQQDSEKRNTSNVGQESNATDGKQEKEYVIKLIPQEKCPEDQRMPPLSKASLKAPLSVKLMKLQKFVHKRIEEVLQNKMDSKQIEILLEDEPITRHGCLVPFKEKLMDQINNDKVIFLQYRRYSKSTTSDDN